MIDLIYEEEKGPTAINLAALPDDIQRSVRVMSLSGCLIYVLRHGNKYKVQPAKEGMEHILERNGWMLVIGYKNGN